MRMRLYNMAGRMPIHFFLLILCVGGLSVYFIQYFRQNLTPKVKEKCTDIKNWCKNTESAITCGVLEFCQMQWKTDVFMNITETKPTIYPPVLVDVYFESLCPDSEKFIKEQLFPTYEKFAGKNILNISLVPYGNAEETRKGDQWLFKCQHGEKECLGNLIETCAIHWLENITKWMPFVYCMEKKGSTLAVAKECFEQQHKDKDFAPIMKCIDGPLGNKLQHEMAAKTAVLKPKHTFIPWITINGKSTGLQTKALYSFMKLICETYTGKKPKECQTKVL